MATDASSARRVAGRYRLDRLLGRGGSGAVWRGHDERLDRPVAVKEITFPIDADEADIGRSRALREARAAARLGGAGVVGIYDIIEGESIVHLIMELVEAPNLATLVRRAGPLTPPTAARLGLHVLDTLEAAHHEGIIHRDIKPSNVLIEGGRPRLADFGIARLGDDSTLTATGVVMGTPAYIAPEHARGDEVGPAADLYGLGATLYYAVEGESPFGASGSVATVVAVLNDAPRPPERAGALSDVLLDLLAKDPNARPDARTLRGRLARVAALAGVLPDDESSQRTTGQVAPDRAIASGAVAVGAGGDVEQGAAQPRIDEATRSADPDAGAVAAASTRDATPDEGAGPRARPDMARAPDWSPRQVRSARRSRSGRAPLRVALALVVAAVIAAAGWWLVDADDGRDRPAAAGVGATPAAGADGAAVPTDRSAAANGSTGASTDGPPPSAVPSQQARDESPTPDADAPSAPRRSSDGVLPAFEDATVPSSWVTFSPADQPYRLAHPPAWEPIRRSARQVDLRDPTSGTYLRLEWVQAALDPVPDRRAQEASFRERYPSYRSLGISATTYKGDPAALWEYRFAVDGVELHAYSLVVNDGEFGRGLNLVARQSNWSEARAAWPAILRSYRFTGG